MLRAIDHPAIAQQLLTITPSLEVVAVLGNVDFKRRFPELRQYLFPGDVRAHPAVFDLVFEHDNGSVNCDVFPLSPADLEALFKQYEGAAGKALRLRPTYLELGSFRLPSGVKAEDGGSKVSTAISWASNFFPDEASVLAIRFDIDDATAWPRLMARRCELIEILGETFWWSTLGYRFRLNLSRIYSAGPEQAALGMRLLGVDWDDPFGGFSALSAYGLRSINWQTVVSRAALVQWTKNDLTHLPPAAIDQHGHHHWQAGGAPSIGDRNAGRSAELSDYVKMGNSLSSICQHFDTRWFGQEVFERWSYRWAEL